jgi:non-ribosomal peptide synthase protein (TIGR01720 family)
MKKTDSLSYKIKKVKETLRRIPHKGAGYGILRYLMPEDKKQGIPFKMQPEINFNYLGQLGFSRETGPNTNDAVFNISPLEMGDNMSPELEAVYTFNISGAVQENKLMIMVSYNKYQYEPNTIERLLKYYHTRLLEIIHLCITREERELTPSDVGDEDLSIEELSEIQEMIQLYEDKK